MAEPTNPSSNKKLEATLVKKGKIDMHQRKQGELPPGTGAKVGNGEGNYAPDYCSDFKLSQVDNDNKLAYNEASFPKKEASDKFKTGDLKNFSSLNRKEAGYTGPASDDKKKAGAGE